MANNTKELVTVEFRYKVKSDSEHDSGHRTKVITIGIFDTLDEAIVEGNKAIGILAEKFEVRPDDRFMLNYLFGSPKRLVTNTCYPTNGVQYFAKIETLKFDDLKDTINQL